MVLFISACRILIEEGNCNGLDNNYPDRLWRTVCDRAGDSDSAPPHAGKVAPDLRFDSDGVVKLRDCCRIGR
jgi:hypothetical protein